ncbi:hypothetical protein BC830DRAFT_64313 [Chytriomyces sp. MP71]|nr:hypothetical protein BC830DRAFT_64313 [Chytriomyces sp. MP71]
MMIRKETLKGAQLSSAALTLKKQSPQNELYVQHLEAELKKLSAANSAEVRIKACRELSNLFYLGGVLETVTTMKRTYYMLMLDFAVPSR